MRSYRMPAADRGDSRRDVLRLGKFTFHSRLLVGTGKFGDTRTMCSAVKASGAELVTVALRRVNRERRSDDLLSPLSRMKGITIVPNTSGACNATEAVRAAMLARELSGSQFVKLEIHPNPHHLMPDPIETLAAAVKLVDEGFTVLPYINADPVLARRLEDAGCAAVMPLGSAIGSGHGLATLKSLEIIVKDAGVPVIVDAGLRSPADAAAAMEIGCGGVLVNTAIAIAGDPEAMADSFRLAVLSGRKAYRAGIMPRSETARATSPLTSFLGNKER